MVSFGVSQIITCADLDVPPVRPPQAFSGSLCNTTRRSHSLPDVVRWAWWLRCSVDWSCWKWIGMIAVAAQCVLPVRQERVVSNGIPVSRKTLHLKAEFCMNFYLTTGALVKLVKLCNSSTSSPRFSDAPVVLLFWVEWPWSWKRIQCCTKQCILPSNLCLRIKSLRFLLRCFCFATCGAPTIDALPYSITSSLEHHHS